MRVRILTNKHYPLENIKVIDFTRVLSGPFCTMLLGDLGAEVIKIERPGVGDENRKVLTYSGRTEKDEDYFYPMNRNKKSIEIDLKSPQDHQILLSLLSDADVIVENFKPGTMKKYGLDYDAVRKIKSDIIYCSISGFGQKGLYKERKAYDSIIQAITGVMSITGEPEGKPLRSGLMFGDLSGSLYAFSAIVTSLYAREKYKKGNYIDLALADSLLSLFSTNAAEFLANGKPPKPVGSENPNRSPSGYYTCKDGKNVQIMGANEAIWPNFCEVLKINHLKNDERFKTNETRVAYRDLLRTILTPIFISNDSDYWVNELNKNGVPCAPINTLEDVFLDPHFLEREMELTLEHPVSGRISTINNPFRFSSFKTWKKIPPPILGQENLEVKNSKISYKGEI
jgi:crotonobetainyl-CoA:carnitine CoA-transferase CaiB-like acyl-CoA transferase